MKEVAESKWEDIKSKLTLVEGWARDGLTNEQIAKNLGISIALLYKYQNEHVEFLEAIKKGKEVVDYEVENALLKRALGYEYEEETYETKYDRENNKYIEVLTKRVTKHVAPDTTAQIFWLKNRKPKQWRDKVEPESNNNIQRIQIINDLPEDDENGTSQD